MRNILALGLASFVAADDALLVDLTVDKAEVHRGESVRYTCNWDLSDTYADYELDDFQLFWKMKDDGEREAIAKWTPSDDPEQNQIVTYRNTRAEGRIELDNDFDEQTAYLDFKNFTLEDDDMDIICEIHWNARFNDASATVQVYVDASDVALDAISYQLESRTILVENGTDIEPEATDVASCTISGVYPKPDAITFMVGDEAVDVPIDEEFVEDDEGLFTVDAVLNLMPSFEQDQAEVTCSSQAGGYAAAAVVQSGANDTMTLEVTYSTNEVTLVIDGASENEEGNYFINEGEEYTVQCTANGNPAPVTEITNSDGNVIESGDSRAAVRTDSLQFISCGANNNEAGYLEVDNTVDSAKLDVYYLDEPVTDIKPEYEYGDDVTLGCFAVGNPEPKISWEKDGQPITDVTFEAITYSDAGTYRCIASNAAKTLDEEKALGVDGPCLVTISGKTPSASQQLDAAALKMECEVQGPSCSVTWSSNSEGLVNLGQTTEVDGKHVLFFSAVDKQVDPVSFTCTAANERGEESDTVVVDESDEPFCCAKTASVGGLGTGAIVGIVIAIPAILIIVGAVVFFCRKSGAGDEKNDGGASDEEAAEPSEKAPLTEGDGGESGTGGQEQV